MKSLRSLALVMALFAFQNPFCLAAPPAAAAHPAPLPIESYFQKPKLILVIVVDQFRADYLTRFESRLLPARAKDGSLGGYRHLLSEGAYFPFAQYDVLQCMTGPGHAMILSGSYPYQMGIPLNGWFDQATRERTYCVQDKSSPIIGAEDGNGLSPRNFIGNTLGDELKNAGHSSRVVTVALKDRSAILLGGHRADLAFWFHPSSFRWVSSAFYLPEKKLPTWLSELNSELAARKGQPVIWKSEGKPTGLSIETAPFERKSIHGNKETLDWPYGVELTVAAAERALTEYKLGRGMATDILAVSFSSHDYLGHKFGPNTLEMEEMTVAEDRILSRFLNQVSKSLPGGLKDVTIVLTADHGIPPKESWLSSQRHPAGRIDGDKVMQAMEARLTEAFGKARGGKWVIFHAELNYSISPEALAQDALGKVTRTQVENVMKSVLQAVPGIAFAFTRTEYHERKLPPGMFERQILKTYVPGRSGDVVGIPRPFYYEEKFDATSHMTSYTYDRSVPLVIMGPRVRKGVYATPADVVDIAPTLAFLNGVLAPASSEGRVLSEIIAPEAARPSN